MRDYDSADALQMQGNAGETAADFLRRLDPTGTHNLVAFDPEKDGPSHGRTFAGGCFSEIAAWVNERDGLFNLYYTANEVRPDFPGTKPRKDDVVAIRAIFADADPLEGELDAERAKVLERVQGVHAFADADLIDSGGGFQLIAPLRDKLPADALNREWAESYGRGLSVQLGTDAVQNIDRLMRLPGAMNIPTPSKLKKGRVPRRAAIVRPHTRSFLKTEIEFAVTPKAHAGSEDKNPRITEVAEQLRLSRYEEADTFERLPAALQDKFRLATSADPALGNLWRGELPPGTTDCTGSSYRWHLALGLGRYGCFDAEDYAQLAFAWPYAVQADQDKYERLDPDGDGPRELARCWVKAAEPAIERLRSFFEPVDTPPDTRDFDAATKMAGSLGRGAEPRRALFFDASTLAGTKAPERVWIVPDLIPRDTVTLFSGDGGTGKSLLSLQLAVAVASGTLWIGMEAKQGTAVFLSAEDDRDELHRRLADIARAGGLEVADMPNLKMSSLAGEDALLAVLRGGLLVATQLYADIDAYLATVGPTLVVLDTSADLYGGNENDRANVRQFVGMLRRLALKYRCAVVLLSHPSLGGMLTGTGQSGSTAWNNSVRSRIYLERIKQEGGKEDDPNVRRLSNKKSNYGPMGVEYALRWQGGVFVSGGAVAEVRAEMEVKARRVFLELLRQYNVNGMPVNPSSSASYAPKVFADHPQAEGLSKAAFKVAMASLLRSEEIKVVVTGPPSRQVRQLVISEPSSPFGERT